MNLRLVVVIVVVGANECAKYRLHGVGVHRVAAPAPTRAIQLLEVRRGRAGNGEVRRFLAGARVLPRVEERSQRRGMTHLLPSIRVHHPKTLRGFWSSAEDNRQLRCPAVKFERKVAFGFAAQRRVLSSTRRT